MHPDIEAPADRVADEVGVPLFHAEVVHRRFATRLADALDEERFAGRG